MSDVAEYGEIQFDDISELGEQTDRLLDIMAVPTFGATPVLRYSVDMDHRSHIRCMALGCDFGYRLTNGAYTTAQDGARVRVLIDGVTAFEHKINWTGLSGYVGGADDYGSESEAMLQTYGISIASSVSISIALTGATAIRRMLYAQIYGTLSDGTEVSRSVKRSVDSTATTMMELYTIPTSMTMSMRGIFLTTRHIDGYAGKGYMVYNGMPVMVFDVMQQDVGPSYGLVFPFWAMHVPEESSIGFRIDDFEAGDEYVFASLYATESTMSSTGTVASASAAFRVLGSPVVRRVIA